MPCTCEAHQELLEIHKILLCTAEAPPAQEGEPYTLHMVKQIIDRQTRLQEALNPRTWTREMSRAWNRNIPNVQKAFEALTEEAMKLHE